MAVKNEAVLNAPLIRQTNPVRSKDIEDYAGTGLMDTILGKGDPDYPSGAYHAGDIKGEEWRHRRALYISAKRLMDRLGKECETEEDRKTFFNTYLQTKENEYVVEGARLECSSQLDAEAIVTINGKPYTFSGIETEPVNRIQNAKGQSSTQGGHPYVIVSDTEKKKNIMPFCKNCCMELSQTFAESHLKGHIGELTKGTCEFMMELNPKWTNVKSGGMFGTPIKGHENGVNMLSHLFCKRGGVIRPVNSGQVGFKGGSGFSIPAEYYLGTNESEQLEYIFGIDNGTLSWSAFSKSLTGEIGKNQATIEVPIWVYDEKGNKAASYKKLTVHEKVAEVVNQIFYEIYNSNEKFVIDVNTTGGYSNRGNTTSMHNYGLAIDINWNANAMYNSNNQIIAGTHYDPLNDPLSMSNNSSVVKSFKKYGWYWGGDWNSSKDYMHFAYTDH